MLSFKHFTNFLDSCKNIRQVSGEIHSQAGSFEMLHILDTAIYKTEWFRTDEIVDPATFAIYGEKSLQFMDARMLWTADSIREYFNKPCVVNNYTSSKPGPVTYKDSGLRIVPVGDATRSQHLYGRALDIKIQDVTAEDARKEIKAKWKVEPAFRFITAMEEGVSWLHVDCRNTNLNELFTFTNAKTV